MSSIGSFGTFTTARLAIYVSQKGLSVTGNNIANINTVGYTRQRLDQVSFKTGMSDLYQNPYDTHVGNGAIARSVSQLRDPYLDVRYRAEHASEGYYNGRLNGLEQVESILDEIGKGKNDGDGLLYAQFKEFFSALQDIQVDAGHQVNDTLAYTSAKALCELFYSAANRLEILQNNTETKLRQEMDSINDTLINIRNLNESIRQAEIHGDGALELRDERNNLIDELSEKVKISATYSMEDVGGKQVEKLTIRLANANPDKDVLSDSSLLVDGNYCAQLTAPKANVDANGKSLFIPEYAIFDKNSTAYENALKEMKNGRPVANPDAANAQFTKQEELDAYIETFMAQAGNKMAPFQYVDPNGVGTNDPRLAEQVFDDHYNITVSDLRDKNNKAWADTPVVQDTYVKPEDLANFPTKAKYTGDFKFAGTWKNGDKVNINVTGGKSITVEVGKDVTADAANEDPKNLSNAIRKAMIDSGEFDDYDITTKTTRATVNGEDGFNVLLTVKAKNPEQKADADMPKFTITADAPKLPAGGAKINLPPTQATDKDNKPIAGQFNAEVTVNTKFNKGDVITIGTGADAIKMEVGKDLSVNAANDPARLAAKLAGKITATGFTVSSTTDKDGKAYLVFKGGKDATAPTTVPQIEQVEAANPVDFTALNGNWVNGKPGTVPKDPPKIVDNGDNTESKVTTRYYMDDDDKWHEVVRTVTSSKTKMLDDNDLFGELQAVRELLTEEGEFASEADIALDEGAAINRGIPFYREALDLLARQFATTMNEANNGFAVDEKGNYLISNDGGETFEKILVNNEPLSKTGMTDDQKALVEADALGNFVKANFAGFVKDADGKDTNVLADKYGNPLTAGGMELTTDNISIDGVSLKDLDFAGVNADGNLVNTNGDVIDADVTDPANPTPKAIEFTAGTFADQASEDAAKADLNEQALDSYLAANGAYKMGGNLFSSRGDTDDASNITALNISVSQSWSDGSVHVVPTYIKLFGGETNNTTQQDNALHMGGLIDKALVYNPQDLIGDAASTHLFEGSFQEMLEKMCTTLGEDKSSTNLSLQTHAGQALSIDTSRDSVSAVDLNDEAMDLMQYTHSLNAAYRLMTTIDEMLERLITGTGVTR